NLTAQEPCALCSDPQRDGRILCVVETVPDLLAVERTRDYRGRYHVLHGALSPLDGVGPEQLRLKELLARLQPREGEPAVEEVILATDPTV
ncbi:toprim domain-containing protein, partial [Acinetobacter baumannii]